MRKHSWIRIGIALLLTTAIVGIPSLAAAAPKDKAQMFDFATGDAVTGGFSKLTRSEDGVATMVRTSAVAGEAYTMWYVIFNAPEECSGGECGEDDVFDMDENNPFAPFNKPQIEAARVSVVFGGDGAVANPGGQLQLNGGLGEGEVPDGPNQVVIGHPDDGALVGLGVVTGLEDAAAAEIHIVLLSHGPAHEDPALLEEQITQFNGACNPEPEDCFDAQFAVHLP